MERSALTRRSVVLLALAACPTTALAAKGPAEGNAEATYEISVVQAQGGALAPKVPMTVAVAPVAAVGPALLGSFGSNRGQRGSLGKCKCKQNSIGRVFVSPRSSK